MGNGGGGGGVWKVLLLQLLQGSESIEGVARERISNISSTRRNASGKEKKRKRKMMERIYQEEWQKIKLEMEDEMAIC